MIFSAGLVEELQKDHMELSDQGWSDQSDETKHPTSYKVGRKTNTP